MRKQFLSILKKQFRLFLIGIFLLIVGYNHAQKTIHYELSVSDTNILFNDKKVKILLVNHQHPMPTLYFTIGDTAEITVHNNLSMETSLHWHGLLLPYIQDGVPYLTTPPIAAFSSFTYRFPIIQSGTYWYHSHTGFQEQLGMYGEIIIHKNDPLTKRYWDSIPAFPLLLSDFTTDNPTQIFRRLKTDNEDWYSIKKKTTQDYLSAIVQGYFKTKIINEVKKMKPMDVSDIYYQQAQINGSKNISLKNVEPNQYIKLQFVNGGASSYFWLRYSGGPLKIVANDGIDVEPVDVDKMLLATAETYDIVVKTPPEGEVFELNITSEDRTITSSVLIGNGSIVKSLPPLEKLKYFNGMKMMNRMVNWSGYMNTNFMNHGLSLNKIDMNSVMYPEAHFSNSMMNMPQTDHSMTNMPQTDHSMMNMETKTNKVFNYGLLRSIQPTSFPDNIPRRQLELKLTGNMNRYLWTINDKTLTEVDRIKIKPNEVVRMILKNESMMRHPMHLHGHYFRVLNGHGVYSPLKNVIDLMPMETDTIEFYTSEKDGAWFFHCHILYHMMSGMSRVFEYENTPINPAFKSQSWANKKLSKEVNRFLGKVFNDFATNGNFGNLMFQNPRWNLGTEWRLGYNETTGWETETHFGRYLGSQQWWFIFIGFDSRYRKTPLGGGLEKNLFGQENSKNQRELFSVGVEYLLPLFITAQLELYHNGYLRFSLGREDIEISNRSRFSFNVNTDFEYTLGYRYIFSKYFSATANLDSDLGFGVGIKFVY
ncbi:MAG: multicopper oxidase domain-containing protein [Sediminibacterium sp.]|nr:multicopper oxidase domain-containing protein [Sediminibacterium sp.]